MTGRESQHAPGQGAGITGWALLAFATAVLGVLAFLPALGGERQRELQVRTESLLEPAIALTGRHSAHQAREMAVLQSFLLTGDPLDRLAYGEALERSRVVEDSLALLTEQISPEVMAAYFDAADAAFRWRTLARPVLQENMGRREFLPRLEETRRLFGETQAANLALERAMVREAGAVRGRMERISRQHQRATVVLSVLALLAALGLTGVARRLQRLARGLARERERAVRARRETAAVMDAAADGIIGLDRTGRCIFINEAALELLGITLSQARGHDIRSFLSSSTVEAAGPFTDREEGTGSAAAGDDSDIVTAEERVDSRGQRSFYARTTVHRIRDGGSSLAAVVTLADVTEARAQAEALRRAVEAREQVLAVVSHDLRNPVGTIQTSSEVILEMENVSPQRKTELLRIIHRTAAGMTRLIRDLLDSAAMEARGFSVHAEPVKMEGLLASVAGGMGVQARTRGVRVVVEEPESPDLEFRADPHRLRQALENLVANALRFAPRGSEIRILGGRAGEDEVFLAVEDQGPGVPETQREKLFEPFYQSPDSDQRGAGLGLSIVMGIARAHGGSARVEEGRSGGARFVIRLPFVEP